MTLYDNQSLLKIVKDLDARLKDVEEELWYSQGYLKKSRENSE